MKPPPEESISIILLSLSETADWTLFVSLGVLALLLVCSALISGSEVAYFSLSPSDMQAIDEESDSANQRISAMLSKPSKLLATILICNNVINIGIVILSTFVLGKWFQFIAENTMLQFLVEVVIVTALLLLFGEVVPKIYAASHALGMARTMALSLSVLNKVFSPLSNVLVRSSAKLRRRFAQNTSGNEVSSDELEHAIELTLDRETTRDEQRILEGIVKFGNIEVRQIMRPRTETVAFDIKTSYSELVRGMIESGHSRFPIYRGSFDDVVGTLVIKDLIPYSDRNQFKWQSLIRTPFVIPENKKLDDLLKEFQEKKVHMAIVVDEYGGTSGIVTLEDVIEEIVGDITDEFDDDEVTYSKLDDFNYVFEGRTLLVDLYRILDLDEEPFEANKGEADTLAGFILEQVGKIPLKNERIRFHDYIFVIEAADKRRIKRVKITLPQEEPEEE